MGLQFLDERGGMMAYGRLQSRRTIVFDIGGVPLNQGETTRDDHP